MSADASHTQRYPVGIASVGLGTVERRVGADEAPPLPPNAELRLIGKSVPRINGRAKVTGAAPFTVDRKLPGMLYGRLLRSPHAHARIRSIDVRAAEALPGVRAIHLIREKVGRAVEERPDGAGEAGRVLYVGDPVVAVAAISDDVARAALDLIRIDYEVLPFVVDVEEARQPDAPLVFDGPVSGESFAGGTLAGAPLAQSGNVRGPNRAGSRGSAAAALATADVTVEATYRTQVQTHCCLEPHGLIADWRDDGLTVHISTQFTAGVRAEIAEAFGLPMTRVRVVVDAMGGGFGSKSSLGNYGRAAVELSRLAGAPVRLVHDRHEEQIDSGNRPATVQHIRLGARRDGALAAMAIDTYGTSGVGLGAGIGNFAQQIYDCPNFEMAQSDVFINAGPGCAMRAPGNVPGAFGLEQAVDELAGKLGIDPLALRERIDPSPVRREERRIGAELFGWSRRRPPGSDAGPLKRGIGMAQSLWGANVQTNAACEVRILRDGSVELLSSVQDIGTGIGTVLAQVVAEELGLKVEDITIRIGDTDFPGGGPSYGSRTTASMTPPARNATWQVLRKLIEQVGPSLQIGPDGISARDGFIVSADGQRRVAFKEAAAQLRTDQASATASRSDDYAGFGRRMHDAALARQSLGGVQFAEVAVDTETGIIRVERVVAVQDCGRPMNPKQIESQVQGGVLMGISYALFEERIIDRQTGHVLNANLEQYKLLGPRETPRIDVHLLENYQGMSATDAYGIAEPANIATAPAIANAVYNAIGVRIRQLPMSPATVLAALDQSRSARP